MVSMHTNVAVVLLALSLGAAAQSAGEHAEIDTIPSLERQRFEALQRASEPTPGLRPTEPQAQWWVEDESPCSQIDRLHVDGPAALATPLHVAFGPATGRCLGARSLTALLPWFDRALASAGFVTSRVVLPEQSLRERELQVVVLAGTVESITADSADVPAGAWWRVLALQAGDLLNVHRLDDALDIYNRLAGIRARFLIEPGAQDGTSRVVLVRQVVVGDDAALSLDRTGDEYGNGRIEWSAGWDEPLGQLDRLAWRASTTFGDTQAHQRTATFDYSAPWSTQVFGLSGMLTRRRQPVSGTTARFVSHSRESQIALRLSRTLWRDASTKWAVAASAGRRSGSAHLDDTELLVQRRDRAYVEGGLDLWARTASAQVSARFRQGASRRHGRRSPFAPDDAQTEWSRLDLDVGADLNFGFMQHWTGTLMVQRLRNPGAPADYFVVGGEGSVRGIAPRAAVAAESGIVWRQTVALGSLPWADLQLRPYLALDAGVVRGASTAALDGRTLAGGGLGFRLSGGPSRHHVSADLMLAGPIVVPRGVRAPPLAPTMHLTLAL